MFEEHFLTERAASLAGYEEWMARARRALSEALPRAPYTGRDPGELRALLEGEPFPRRAWAPEEVEEQLRLLVAHSVAAYHPRTSAHLHTPVLLPALAAEAVLSALNQSLDSFDQAPMATMVELEFLGWLARLAGLPRKASGTMTAGGTQSNYMGLLLARDRFIARRWNWDTGELGLPPEASRMRVLCSEMAHFSVLKSAMQLGLGRQAVVAVPVDARFRMRMDALEDRVRGLRAAGLKPFAVVGTAGTTDFGSIDPLSEMASLAAHEGLWFHVDAAYGGALLLSDRHKGRLEGIGRADSVTVDFHKAFFQPISCGAFLVADEADFDSMCVHADYLNSEERAEQGIPDLCTRSVLTTRRWDSLKPWISLKAVGQSTYAAMVERLVDLAAFAARAIGRNPNFELLHEPEFGCVTFRVRGDDGANRRLPDELFRAGRAVLGHTKVHGRPSLKLTFNNPCVSEEEVAELLEEVAAGTLVTAL